MKKRLLSILLTLCMVLALMPGTALAATWYVEGEDVPPMDTSEALAPVSVNLGECPAVAREETLYYYDSGWVSEKQLSRVGAVSSSNKITVSHTGGDPNTFIFMYFRRYEKITESKVLTTNEYDAATEEFSYPEVDFKDKYFASLEFCDYYLSNKAGGDGYSDEIDQSFADNTGKYWNHSTPYPIQGDNYGGELYVDEMVDPIMIYPGDSVTFTLPNDSSDSIYQLRTAIYYPYDNRFYWREYDLLVENSSETPAEETPQSVIYFTGEKLYDSGVNYDYTITNYTQEPMEGCYALLTYLTERGTRDNLIAQFFQFDLNLAPGQSVSGVVNSDFWGLSQQNLYWVEFNSKEERDAFFQDSNFTHIKMPDVFANQYGVNSNQTLDWLSGKVGTKLG